MPSILDIMALFERFGNQSYGEGVSQLEHALQSAQLARQEGVGVELIAAALLHDVGHFLADPAETAANQLRDARHEVVAAEWLAPLFGPAVTEPIRLHVEAKRCLCAERPVYLADLSAASRQSLAVQGGPHSPAEVASFLAHPHADAALRLRGWDDAAKVIGMPTPKLDEFFATLEAARRLA